MSRLFCLIEVHTLIGQYIVLIVLGCTKSHVSTTGTICFNMLVVIKCYNLLMVSLVDNLPRVRFMGPIPLRQ